MGLLSMGDVPPGSVHVQRRSWRAAATAGRERHVASIDTTLSDASSEMLTLSQAPHQTRAVRLARNRWRHAHRRRDPVLGVVERELHDEPGRPLRDQARDRRVP